MGGRSRLPKACRSSAKVLHNEVNNIPFSADFISTIEGLLLVIEGLLQHAETPSISSRPSSRATPGITAAQGRLNAAAGRELMRALVGTRSPHRGASSAKARRAWLKISCTHSSGCWLVVCSCRVQKCESVRLPKWTMWV